MPTRCIAKPSRGRSSGPAPDVRLAGEIFGKDRHEAARGLWKPGRRCRWLTLEHLEQRWLLSAPSVLEVEPPDNSHLASVDAPLRVQFDQPVDPETVTLQSLVVRGAQSGRTVDASEGTIRVDDGEIVISPPQSFHTGETVHVTATDMLRGLDDEPAIPAVWQYRTAVTRGTGRFGDSGQTLEGPGSSRVAIGDLDGDGDLDAVGGDYRLPVRVWLNDGAAEFVPTSQVFPFMPVGDLSLGDLDGDGDLDIFIANRNYANDTWANQVWLNDGNGTFRDSGQRLGDAGGSDVALGDVDADGDLDAYVVSWPLDELWLNDGSGTFTDSGRALADSVIGRASVAWGDVDGDRDLDIVVVASRVPTKGVLPVNVWLNDGGVFRDTNQAFGEEAQSVLLGDLDGDRDLDLIAGRRVWTNDGGGVFQRTPWTIGNDEAISLDDLDGDGDLDVVALRDRHLLTVWLNLGHGQFHDSRQQIGNASTRHAALGDLDGDGDLDAFVASRGFDVAGNRVWLNADVLADLSVTFDEPLTRVVPGEPLAFEFVVANQGPRRVDGATVVDRFPVELLDVRWTCTASDGSTCAPGGFGDIRDTVELAVDGAVTYRVTTTLAPSTIQSFTNVVQVGDITGLQDLEPANDTAELLMMVGPYEILPAPGSHTAPSSEPIVAIFPHELDPGSVSSRSFVVHGMTTGQVPESFGKTEVSENSLTANHGIGLHSGEIIQVSATERLIYADGQHLAEPSVWQYRTAATAGTGMFSDDGQRLEGRVLAMGDLDGDGDLDAVLNHHSGIWLNDGSGSFAPTRQVFRGAPFDRVTLGDIDGDGDLDMFMGGYRDGRGGPDTVWINVNAAPGYFVDSGLQLGKAPTRAIALGDLDGDGDLDAFVANSGFRESQNDYDTVWLNEYAASGIFVDSGQRLDVSDSCAVALGDLDGDGDLDALVGSNTSKRATVWLNEGRASFRSNGQQMGPSNTCALDLGDLDGDGDLDALVGAGQNGNLIWMNDGQGGFADIGQSLGTAAERSGGEVSLADVDADGDLDALVADGNRQEMNVWLNDGSGRFVESGQVFATTGDRLKVGDVDGDGDIDALLTEATGTSVWKNVEVPADLTVTVKNDQFVVTPGDQTSYVVTVTNEGPRDVNDATVHDDLPQQIANASWTCAAAEGSRCTPFGTGAIDDSVTLPAGGAVTYTINGTIDSAATGPISNTATVVGPLGGPDLRPANNSSTDVDMVPAVVTSPPLNSHTAAVDSEVMAGFSVDVLPENVTAESFVVHALQTGRLTEPPATVTVSGRTVALKPGTPLHPGELVQVTATGELVEQPASSFANSYVWQFYAAPAGGTGMLGDSGRRLGRSPVQAISWGDLDHDGDVDAFVANGVHATVWLNDGQGHFEDSGQILERRSSAVALGDFDGDGDLDAAVAARNNPGSIWMNDGQARFSLVQDDLERSESVRIADLDGDGDLDVLAAGVWLNDGRGSFLQVPSGSLPGESRTVAMGDMDGDGDIDVLGINDDGRAAVWFNDSNGDFTLDGRAFGRTATRQIAVGDFDADGDFDAAAMNSEGVTIWANDGSGMLRETGQRIGDGRMGAMGLADLDADGDLDILLGRQPSREETVGFNQVWLNDGTGTFGDSGQRLGRSNTRDLSFADVDGDGDLDVIEITTGTVFDSTYAPVRVWLNSDLASDLAVEIHDDNYFVQPGQTVEFTIAVTNHGPEPVMEGRVLSNLSSQLTDVMWRCEASAGSRCVADGVGQIDETVDLPPGGTVTYRATGAVSPAATGPMINSATVAAPMGLQDIGLKNNTAADTNVVLPWITSPSVNANDAPVTTDVTILFPEAVDPSTISEQTFVVHGSQTGRRPLPPNAIVVDGNRVTLRHDRPFQPGEQVRVTATSDIRSVDGTRQANPQVWQFHVATQTAGGVFRETDHLPVRDIADNAVLGDLDSDGDLDAIVFGSGRNKIWLNDGRGRFEDTGKRVGQSETDAIVVLGDLDGDGDLDALLIGHERGSDVNRVFLNDGEASFHDSGHTLGLDAGGSLALGDMDADGDLDAVITGGTFGSSSTWINDGQARFQLGQDLADANGTSVLALGDVDGDGDLDVLIGRRSRAGGTDKLWLNDGTGALSKGRDFLVSAVGEHAIALADVDGDGDLDAMVGASGFAGEHNRVWLNDGSGNFVDTGQSLSTNSQPNFAVGDIDGDGDVDALISGQLWLNDGRGMFAKTSGSLHGGVAFGDLDGDGDLDALSVDRSRPNRVWLNGFAPGDANADGRFDFHDLVQVLEASKYRSALEASFEEGDWNADGAFDQYDLVLALQTGTYSAVGELALRWITTHRAAADEAFADSAFEL